MGGSPLVRAPYEYQMQQQLYLHHQQQQQAGVKVADYATPFSSLTDVVERLKPFILNRRKLSIEDEMTAMAQRYEQDVVRLGEQAVRLGARRVLAEPISLVMDDVSLLTSRLFLRGIRDDINS